MFLNRRRAIAIPFTGAVAFSQTGKDGSDPSKGTKPQTQETLLKELDRESKSARILIFRLPADHFDWRPHAKSRPLGELAWHLASIPGVVSIVAFNGVQEVTKVPWPTRPRTVAGMVEGFDSSLASAKANLARHSDADFAKPFAMRKGDAELFSMSAGEFVRWGLMTHFVHHRAQVGLYLRMLDVEVPAMVGPSADEFTFLR